MLRFEALAPVWNGVLFAVAAAIVWKTGVRLTRIAKGISDQLGGKQAIIGMVLLGGIVSLPEMATSVAASLIGNAPLAINTLLGGIAVTMAILAVVDAIVGHEPLSVDVAHPIVLLQGSLVVLLLSIAAAGMIAGDVSLLNTGIGAWTSAILLLYIAFVILAKRYEGAEPWVPTRVPEARRAGRARAEPSAHAPMTRLILRAAATGALTVVAGYVLAGTGDALSAQTGLSGGLVGLVLGGIATSLPELSTMLEAVRQREYEMAFADAFGSNLFSTTLLFFADAAYSDQPLLNTAGRFSIFAVLLGIAVTTVYLAGLIVRRDRAVFGMGVDSAAVLFLYGGGLIVLFYLR
ncbi:MAG TPA: sodium:calcium antiporter [Alphaproteobacteria bacterium]